jgi:ubiquinone/menaquinone biosynthesis C-methylase UbiE
MNYSAYNCHSVLDIGCGTGDFASLFDKKEYLGIDINKDYISYARKKYPHSFVSGDAVEYNFDLRSFDASIFISTLHHLSDDQAKKLFAKIIDLTKKIIIIVDLNPETSFFKKMLIKLDRGDYIRTTQQKISLLSGFGKIAKIVHFSTGLASQTGMVLLPYGKKQK